MPLVKATTEVCSTWLSCLNAGSFGACRRSWFNCAGVMPELPTTSLRALAIAVCRFTMRCACGLLSGAHGLPVAGSIPARPRPFMYASPAFLPAASAVSPLRNKQGPRRASRPPE